MIQLFVDNPLLVLFLIAALSYPLGRIRVGGASLGVAAVLFVGLAIGALDPGIRVPEILWELGLVIFVYTIGLSTAPGFFASFRRKGVRDNALVLGMLLVAALLVVGAYLLLNLPATLAAGLYAGSLTNTPALATVLEQVRAVAPPALVETMLAEPVIGYSIAYPVGVLGMILAIALLQRWWKVDYAAEQNALRELHASNQRLFSRTLVVTRPEATGVPVRSLVERQGWNVVFGRVEHAGELSLVEGDTRLASGDLLSVVGAAEELDAVTAFIGEESDRELALDRTNMDYRRIFVSNPDVVGHTLKELNLPQQFGAVVTRLRRGDVDMLTHGDTSLELGDRVRVVTRRENMEAVSRFFGDSYRALSEIDILTFSLGLALGILVGLIPIPLPGGAVFSLGFAGGPLLVSLLLGWRARTGPLVWLLPYSANLTLRQIGLVFFLAGVGTRAGYAFFDTLRGGGGLLLFAAGAFITCVIAFLTLWIGHRLLKIPMGILIGMLAGMQTQPAVLGFALEQAENDLPNIGYATVYPLATIGKILLAQFLLVALS